jgi:hypothetical protein
VILVCETAASHSLPKAVMDHALGCRSGSVACGVAEDITSAECHSTPVRRETGPPLTACAAA